MRLRRLLLILLMLLLPCTALTASLAWEEVPALLRPGKTLRFVLSAPAGEVSLSLTTPTGDSLPLTTLSAPGGGLTFPWDGTVERKALPAGEYTLTASQGKKEAAVSLVIGEKAPLLLSITADEQAHDAWCATVETSCEGTLTMTLQGEEEILLVSEAVVAGENLLFWDGTCHGEALPAGDYDLTFRLTDETGFSSAPETLNVLVEAPYVPQPAQDLTEVTPGDFTSMVCDRDPCYWHLPMGSLDEEAVWAVLTQPVTVLKGDQRQQTKVLAQPDKNCTDYVGEVTQESQAVHVLKTEGDWAYIEAYSSSVEGSSVAVWAERFEGWIPAKLLVEKEVSQELGIVIDKLQQRLYVYREGKLFSTLLCSTGYPRSDTPFNETPAGEFLAISWTGGFWSNNLFCDMGIRINDGILLHEVPCRIRVNEETGEETKDYSRCLPYLGEKASHGCIRIQVDKTPQGCNMKWLWDNLPRKGATKVMIWDEVGRSLGYPDADYPLYYNPDGGKQYHSDPRCLLVSERFWPLTAFTWGELEEEGFSHLTRCPGCAPQLRMTEIDTVNEKNNRRVNVR